MKKLIFVSLFSIIFSGLKAQFKASDVFAKDEIVWMGLDFSKAKIVGAFDQGAGVGAASGSDIKAKYVPAWNEVILNEPKKYDIGKTFRKTSAFVDLSPVNKSNASIDPDNIMTYNDYKFEDPNATIQKIVSGYSAGEKKEGIGLVFIVESFSKTKELASVYVTFIDIATKKVLFTEKMTGKPGGFGLRNYWMGGIKQILTHVDRYDYKLWTDKYAK